MSRKRTRKGARVVDDDANKIVASLPNELLLEVWDVLPALERICVSQVCQKWRRIALSVPKLWSCVALVSTSHNGWCHCTRRPASATRSIYSPRNHSDNLEFSSELLLRSQKLPLDVIVDGCIYRSDNIFSSVLRPQRDRIVRIHFATGEAHRFNDFLRGCGHLLPALRTLTAGFDDREVEYSNLPPRITAGSALPALRQVHIGAGAASDFIYWSDIPMPGIQELTLSFAEIKPVMDALSSCTNLARLTLVMADFLPSRHEASSTRFKAKTRYCVDALARVPELCFTDIAAAQENFILTNFDDARFHNLTLDYMGRARRPGSSWYLSLPSPCDALADPVRLTLRLRDSVYEIAVVDPNGLHREIFLDHDTIRMAPGLWNCYLKRRTVASATVDAVAWTYFEDGLPDACAIPELELVVLQRPAELDGVSLSHFTNLHKLRIDVVKPGMKFASATVQKLVQSRGGRGAAVSLPILSLSPKATYEEGLSMLANSLESI